MNIDSDLADEQQLPDEEPEVCFKVTETELLELASGLFKEGYRTKALELGSGDKLEWEARSAAAVKVRQLLHGREPLT